MEDPNRPPPLCLLNGQVVYRPSPPTGKTLVGYPSWMSPPPPQEDPNEPPPLCLPNGQVVYRPSPPTGKTPVGYPSWMSPPRPPPQEDPNEPPPLYLPNGQVVYRPSLPTGKTPVDYPSWMSPPRPLEDDSWLDEEIAKEDDEIMKHIMIEAKRSMRYLSNEKKREYISDERKRIIERKQYANDMNTTQGFDVGDYPYLARKLCGAFITRYYYPPDTTITDFELDKLTRFANLAIQHFNSEHGKDYTNVKVSKAMRSFSRGFWYYLTLQASLPDGESPQTFEAKLYDHPPLPTSYVEIDFVRLKNVN